MEKRALKLLLICSILTFLVFSIIQCVSAANWVSDTLGEKNPLTSVIKFIGGESDNYQLFITWLAFFAVIFVASADIIQTFGFLSPMTAWITGFALAIVLSVTRTISMLALAMFGILSGLGAIAIIIIIGSAFFAAVVVHLGAGGFASWIARRQVMMKAARGETEALAGLETLRGVGRATTH